MPKAVRIYRCWMAIGLLAPLTIAGCRAFQPRPQGPTRFLFTVPVKLPDGRSSEPQVAELKRKLIEWAGGYTVIGRGEGGWWNGRRTVTDENLIFFVQGPPDLRDRVSEFIEERFHQQEAFISGW